MDLLSVSAIIDPEIIAVHKRFVSHLRSLKKKEKDAKPSQIDGSENDRSVRLVQKKAQKYLFLILNFGAFRTSNYKTNSLGGIHLV